MDNGQGAMHEERGTAYKVVLIVVFLFSCPLSIASAYSFTRDLTLGSEGEDVRQLQILLNQKAATQVSYSGVGSPGQETTHFGPKTQAAVIRYQNLFASKILTPVGLSVGTGYVGGSTRAHMSGGNSAPSFQSTTLVLEGRTPLPQPATQTEMTISLQAFAGTNEPTDEDIREYARSRVLATQGIVYAPETATKSSTTTQTTSTTMSGTTGGSSSSGSNSNTGTTTRPKPTRADADEGSNKSLAGCADLLLDLLGL